MFCRVVVLVDPSDRPVVLSVRWRLRERRNTLGGW